MCFNPTSLLLQRAVVQLAMAVSRNGYPFPFVAGTPSLPSPTPTTAAKFSRPTVEALAPRCRSQAYWEVTRHELGSEGSPLAFWLLYWSFSLEWSTLLGTFQYGNPEALLTTLSPTENLPWCWHRTVHSSQCLSHHPASPRIPADGRATIKIGGNLKLLWLDAMPSVP